jgi:hypothetical protein
MDTSIVTIYEAKVEDCKAVDILWSWYLHLDSNC